ncbi:hypothetical protein GGR54DRAFT_654880 [Hypoxylon sp. NC1633]|nr:hypothetical protein GGR54DRAFT_654880 [Hypoxylon sp. NC1633]
MLLCVHVGAAFICGIILTNALGAIWYAEVENSFKIRKIVLLSAFIIVAILISNKAIPTDGRPALEFGFNLWKRDAFKNRAVGFPCAFMAAGMACGGTKMLGLAAAEAEKLHTVMSLACKIVPARVASNVISPFVMATDQAGIPVFRSIFNGIIMVVIFSMASASAFTKVKCGHLMLAPVAVFLVPFLSLVKGSKQLQTATSAYRIDFPQHF